MPSAILSLDFETASLIELPKVGAHAYARHPSTRVLLLGWAFDDEPVAEWRPGQPFPLRIVTHILNGGIVRGWNVTFEWLIYNLVLPRQVDRAIGQIEPGQLSDTMAAAAYWGLPLGLDAAAKAVRANITKDADGHKLMLQMCRPRRVDPFTGKATWWHEDDPAKYDRLGVYCQGDVKAERAIAALIPPLPDDEQRYWVMDLEMNARGVPLDTDLVRQLQALAYEAARNANTTLTQITNGQVRTVTSTAAMLGYLKGQGYPPDNLRKDTVAERLDDPACVGRERQVLELRADTAKTSAAKLDAMLATTLNGSGLQVVRGMIQYYGAIRTGRWAGRLIQMQNLPRGTIKLIEEVIGAIEAGATLEMLELIFGPAMEIVTSALRGCITASPGHRLIVADFSQIEARVLAWLAGQTDMLDVFADPKQDPYVYAASLQGSDNRQFGKVLVLALGYGMGAERFQATAKLYGITLSGVQSSAAVHQWRDDNEDTRQFWWDIDAAVKKAIAQPAQIQMVRSIQIVVWRGHLLIRLPSGRKLVYREVRLEPDPVRPEYMAITYMGINQYTRQWQRIRSWGSKFVENITQAAARDVMAEACLAGLDQQIDLFLMVHDELIGESPAWQASGQLDAMLAIMRTPPKWAADLPVDAQGWAGQRYRK